MVTTWQGLNADIINPGWNQSGSGPYGKLGEGQSEEHVRSIDNKFRQLFKRGMPGDVFDEVKGNRAYADQLMDAMNKGILKSDKKAGTVYIDTQALMKLPEADIAAYDTAGLVNTGEYEAAKLTAKTDADKAALDAKAVDAYKPSQAVLDVEKQVRDILANPEVVDPEAVKKWKSWLDTTNAGGDAMARTRLQEQFSALGDLGSSANRQAIAQAQVGQDVTRSGQAVDLATQQLSQKTGQVNNALSSLMGIGTYEDQLRLIPLNQEFQKYMTQQGQAFDLTKTNLLNTLNQQNLAHQSRDTMSFYKQNQAQQPEWWQPILNAGLTGAGYALGGPLGGAAAEGIKGLFSPKKTAAPAQQTATSLYFGEELSKP